LVFALAIDVAVVLLMEMAGASEWGLLVEWVLV
jgi:hypothetical protein